MVVAVIAEHEVNVHNVADADDVGIGLQPAIVGEGSAGHREEGRERQGSFHENNLQGIYGESKIADNFAACASSEGTPDGCRDAVVDEANSAVAKQEVDAARMPASRG